MTANTLERQPGFTDGVPPIDEKTLVGNSDGKCTEVANGVFSMMNPHRCTKVVNHEPPHKDFTGQEF